MIDYQEFSWVLTCVFAVTVTLATIRRMYLDRKEHEKIIEKFEAETDYYKKKIGKLEGENEEE